MKAGPTCPGASVAGVVPWLFPAATSLPAGVRAEPVISRCETASFVLFRIALGRTAAPLEPAFNEPTVTTSSLPGVPVGDSGLAVPLRRPVAVIGADLGSRGVVGGAVDVVGEADTAWAEPVDVAAKHRQPQAGRAKRTAAVHTAHLTFDFHHAEATPPVTHSYDGMPDGSTKTADVRSRCSACPPGVPRTMWPTAVQKM